MSERRFQVVAQSWISEKPNQPKREDGWSLHLTEQDRARYVRRFLASLHRGDDGYSRPESVVEDFLVKENIFVELEEVTKRRGLLGLRFYTFSLQDLQPVRSQRSSGSGIWSGFDGFHDF